MKYKHTPDADKLPLSPQVPNSKYLTVQLNPILLTQPTYRILGMVGQNQVCTSSFKAS